VVSLADGLRLVARREIPPGWCASLQVQLPLYPPPEDAPPDRNPYCGDECRKAAPAALAANETATLSLTETLLALEVHGVPITVVSNTVAFGPVDGDLESAVRHHREALRAALVRARRIAAGYRAAGGPAGPWLCCTACGEGQLLGRAALGRRCRITPRCAGVLAIAVDPAASSSARRH
jgi:hypothetical protein